MQKLHFKFISAQLIINTKLSSHRIIRLVRPQPVDPAPLLLFIACIRRHPRDRAPGRSRLHQLLIWRIPTLVQQYIQSFLVNPRLRTLDLRVLLICGINNRGATHFRHLLSVPVENPTANLARAYDVLYEQDAAAVPQGQLIKELDVFKKVVIGGRRVGVFVVVAVDEQFDGGFCRRADQHFFLLL